MAGTKIDVSAVGKAGGSYSTVADTLGTVGGRIRGYTAEPGDFGRKYRASGEAYGAALASLASAVDAWRDGARACGNGLTASATAHLGTDTGAAKTVTEVGAGG